MTGCTKCPAGSSQPQIAAHPIEIVRKRRVAVLGQPNCGKSMLFNRITHAGARVGNWPGITVDLLSARLRLNDKLVEFVDLPGIYDLEGFSDDEQVVRTFLSSTPCDLLVLVLNATQIDRQARMVMQASALGIPAIVVLNMVDEARRLGIQIDLKMLADRWSLPTYLISAKYGQGLKELLSGVTQSLERTQVELDWPIDISARLATQQIEPSQIRALTQGAVIMPPPELETRTDRIDRALLHPYLGIPLFFLSMLGVFYLIWFVGLPSQDLAEMITGWIQSSLIEPVIRPLPETLQSLILEGIWGGVATVASFLPLIVVFFFVMAVVEDSGYLSRAAFMMDAWMSRVGLDGRGFVMQMMGFGCNVPALMGTRVIRSRPMRLLSMLVIPFSLCSARLAVFVFIIAAVFPEQQGALILFLLYVLSFVSAFIAAAIFSRHKQFIHAEPFVLELPPYRMPTLRQVLMRGWGEVRAFLSRATLFIMIGCVGVWALTHFPPGATGLETWGGQLGAWLAPIMQPIGIDPQLTLALVFGFIAKEIVVGSLATIYAMGEDGVAQAIAGSLSAADAIGFCVFTLLYTPCLATIATLKAESKSWSYTLFTLGFSLVYAWTMAFLARKLTLLALA